MSCVYRPLGSVTTAVGHTCTINLRGNTDTSLYAWHTVPSTHRSHLRVHQSTLTLSRKCPQPRRAAGNSRSGAACSNGDISCIDAAPERQYTTTTCNRPSICNHKLTEGFHPNQRHRNPLHLLKLGKIYAISFNYRITAKEIVLRTRTDSQHCCRPYRRRDSISSYESISAL